MSEELANTIGLWLLLPSLAVLILQQVALVVGVPAGVRRRRRERQLAELEQRQADGERTLEIDWLRYKEIPKPELLERLGKHGWHHLGDQFEENAWLLRFSLDPVTDPWPEARMPPDAHTRLAEELAQAEPRADGTYLLDSSQYADLELAEIHRAAQSAGWQVERLTRESSRRVLVLTRPGSTPVDFADGPFMGSSTPAELRENPAVRARAREIKQEKGFDPLADSVLDRARQRHKHWAKQFNRQVRLAFLYGFIGLFLIGGTIMSAGGGSFYLLLGISLIVLALFGITVLKATLIRKRRHGEIGDILEAYEQLQRIPEQEDTVP